MPVTFTIPVIPRLYINQFALLPPVPVSVPPLSVRGPIDSTSLAVLVTTPPAWMISGVRIVEPPPPRALPSENCSVPPLPTVIEAAW